jgi:oligoribonuclease NrnB/cAMP/cGMP phosphodiesterase (DHH superfamily)
MIIFYHNDLDGIASAAIILQKYPKAKCVPMQYGIDFPWHMITKKDEDVIMVDFCLKPFEDMQKLDSMCNLFWIDHHISVIKDYNKSDMKIHAYLGNTKSACELTWEYYNTVSVIPIAITLLGAADIFNKNTGYDWETEIIPFQYAMYPALTPKHRIWKKLLSIIDIDDKKIQKIIKLGRKQYKGILKRQEEDCKRLCFETEFEGRKCIAMNKGGGSAMFKYAWDNTKYDLMLTFVFQQNCWNISLYTDKDDLDLSEIAKRYGGGGHRQACGFISKELPIQLPK